jgi:pimeloyl-ACP methyl ester carboxylesterase
VTPADRTVELRSGAVRIRVLSAGTGRPLVYFHSLFDRAPWFPLLDRLADRYTVFAPQHPGVGGSEGEEHVENVVDLALVYDELLDALGLGTTHLAGHFFGGMVAAEVAAIFRHRVDRLALLAPLGLWRDEAPVADVLILPGDELRSLLWADPGSPTAASWAAEPEADEDKVAAEIEAIQRRAAMGRFVWPVPDKGLKHRLHRISAPTVVLWGDADRVSPLVYAEDWQRRVKGAELRLLRGGHMLPHEAPGAVAGALAGFLG